MKKTVKLAAVFLMTFLVGICIGTGGTEAKAAVGQADAQKTSITVNWTAEEDAVSYNVYIKEYNSEAEYGFAGSTTGLSYTFTGLRPAEKYSVEVRAVQADGREVWGSTLDEAVTIPDKLTGLRQERWYYFVKKLNIEWDKQTAAEGYEINLYDNKGKRVKSIQEGSYSGSTMFSVKNNIVYKVMARSFTTFNGQTYYSDWSTIYCLNQPMISKLKVSKNKLEVKWKKTNGATEYRVYVSTKEKTGYKKVATVSKNKSSCTVKKLKGKKFASKKKYYVYVEAICKKDGTINTSSSLYCWNTKRGGGDNNWFHRL